MDGFSTVSVSVGLICLVAAGVIRVFYKGKWPRVIIALVLTGATGIFNGTLGPYVHRIATKVDALAASWAGRLTGEGVTGLLAAAVVLALIGLLATNTINKWTYGAAIATPAVVATIPGMFGTVVMTAVGFVPWLVAGLVGLLWSGAWGV